MSFAWIALLCTLSGAGAPTAQDRPAPPGPPSVQVSGTGEVTAKPDMAVVQVGVVSEAESAASALQSNNQAMQSLFEMLQNQGIADRDMQTVSFQLNPQSQRDPQQIDPRIIGYRAVNEVQVKVRQLGELGTLLDRMVKVGANRVRNVQFQVAEPGPLQDEARRLAVREARRVAELLASEAGRAVGEPLDIVEGGGGGPRPMMTARMAAAEAVPLAAGELTISASVTITYRLVSGPAPGDSPGD